MILFQVGADRDRPLIRKEHRPTPMLGETVDAVVGVDAHRDTHEAEIAHPTGAAIAVRSVGNHSSGYAELLAWIVEHAPSQRIVVAVEGTSSYGAGLTRALKAAGTVVLESEQSTRRMRRGKGKSDAIDAHLAVLHALQLDADRLPTPSVDWDREAFRVLLTAREELRRRRDQPAQGAAAARRRHRSAAGSRQAHPPLAVTERDQ